MKLKSFKGGYFRFLLNYNVFKLVLYPFLMVLDMSAIEVGAKLHVDESLKMEAKLGDRRNLASSHSYNYFIQEIPQGFFL